MVRTNTAGIDPWQAAFDGLPPELKASLIASRGYKLDVIAAVLDEAEQKKKICLQKRWKIKFHGHTIILRDIFDKIIAWANEYRAIGDVAMQFDPAAASLPWAGAAVTDHSCFESTIYGLELASLIIARYSAFEALYMARGSLVHAELQRNLTCLYSKVLIFLANGVKYFSQSTAARMLKSIFQFEQSKDLKEISELDEEVGKFTRMFDTQMRQETHSEVEKVRGIIESLKRPVGRLVDASAIYVKTLQEQQFHDFLKWLSPVPFSHHHARHSSERLPGSTKWLLDHSQYVSWKTRSASSLLLLHGIPGCGKTSLTSTVIDVLLDEKHKNELAAPVAYFYCGDSKVGRGRAEPDEVMRSLIRQFAVINKTKHEIQEQVSLEYERRAAEAKLDGFEVPRLQSFDCANMILNVLASNPATIVVDGVDEVETVRRYALLESLIRIRDESSSVVKIFLSSRDDVNIFAHLPDAIMVRVQETDTRRDMELFVRHRVSTAIANRNLLDGNVPRSLQDDLISFLLDRAGEMFLWVVLQLERLCELKSRSSILEAMKERSKVTTTTLEYLYCEILDAISAVDSASYDIATNAFSWLMSMHEPLSPKVFLAAVSASKSDSGPDLTLPELFSICSNLIVLDSKADTIRFTHSSFKEFLEAKPEFGTVHVQGVAAMSCLDICNLQLPGEIQGELHPHGDLGLYAALYWPAHCSAVLVHSSQHKSLALKLKEFVFSDENETSLPFLTWLDTAEQTSDLLAHDHALKKELNAVMSPAGTPLFTACIYGLDSLLQAVANRQDFEVDQKNSIGHTGLYLASAFGRHKIAHELLQLGADMNIQCGQHGNALFAAVFGGYAEVVQLLINHRAGGESLNTIESALNVSFSTGRENIAKLLLDVRPKISTQHDYDKIYEGASQAGFYDLVAQLVRCFPSFNRTASPTSKAIDTAIRKGQLAFLEKCIKKGLIVDHPVATAALFGQTEIALLCLNEGFDIEKEGPFGTPLRAACLMGHDSTARMLLEQGTNVNACGTFGDALQAAAMNGHSCVIDILIQYGADVNCHGGYYGTPLQAAAYRGHRVVAEMLIDAGAEITRAGRYKDAFHAASEAGQERIISLFLKRGYYFREKPRRHMAGMFHRGHHCNLLREALSDESSNHALSEIESGRRSYLKETVNIPLSNFRAIFNTTRGAVILGTREEDDPYHLCSSPEQSEEPMNYSLEAAAAKGQVKTVQVILENRKQFKVRNHLVGRALWAASEFNHAIVVGFLLSGDIDLRSYVEGALARAACHGHIDILEQLLEYEETWGHIHIDIKKKRGDASYPDSGWESYWPEEQRQGSLYRQCYPDFNDLFTHSYGPAIFLAGCRGNQRSCVVRGLRLIDSAERQRLQTIALQEAAMSNSTEVISFLTQELRILDHDSLSQALQAAAKCGAKAALSCLIKEDYWKCLHIDDYRSALLSAAARGHTEAVKYLIEKDTANLDPSIIKKPFIRAAQKGHIDMVKLLNTGMRKYESYHTILDKALNEACRAGHQIVAEFLILAGANLNALVNEIPELCDGSDDDNDCQTFALSKHRSSETDGWPSTALQACLDAIPYCSPNTLKGSPSYFREKKEAIVMKQESIVKLLLENGADTNLTASCRKAPLRSAVLRCTEETVRTMIEHGGNISPQASEDGTLLQWAVQREVGLLPIVHVLLAAGSKITLDDSPDMSSGSVLDILLTHFRSDPPKKRTIVMMLGTPPSDGRFTESKSLEEVLTTGAGGVIKLLLKSNPVLLAKDKRFSLVLQMAAAAGDVDFVKLLIDRKVDVNLRGHYFGNALQAAARLGHFDCVNQLLEAGADVHMIQGSHGTPLLAAIKGARNQVVHTLVSRGADVNTRIGESDSYFRVIEHTSAIELAVTSKNWDIARYLIDAGARVEHGTPALHLAIKYGDLDMVRLLLKLGTDDLNTYDSRVPLLITACETKKYEMVEALLSSGADANVTGTPSHSRPNDVSPLHRACSDGREDIVQLLLRRGADPNNRVLGYTTPLAVAARAGHLGIQEQLLQKGATVYDSPRMPNVLVEACKGQRPVPTLEFLCQRLAKFSKLVSACEEALPAVGQADDKISFMLLLRQVPKTPSLMAQACRFGPKDAIELILASGVDVDSDFDYGGRALHLAAYYQKPAIVQLLIKKRANIHHKSPTYGTPVSAALEGLLAASRSVQLHSTNAKGFREMLPEVPSSRRRLFGHRVEIENQASCWEVVRILLNSGANVNAGARALGSPLQIASYIGSLPLVQLCLDKGADVNAVGGYFGSPLLATITGDNLEVARKLLEKGADPNLVDGQICTPLTWAIGNAEHALVMLLLRKMATRDLGDNDRLIALERAVMNGRRTVTKNYLKNWYYLEDSVKYEENWNAISEWAIEYGVSETLLETNNHNPECQRHMLFAAVRGGHQSEVKRLLKAGTCVDVMDNAGGTALLRAIDNNRILMVEVLIEQGANVHHTDTSGRGMLHSAAANERTEIIRILLEVGKTLDVNIQDINGKTALHEIARHGCDDTAKVLVEYGADPLIKDQRGQTAIHEAKKRGNSVTEILRSAVPEGASDEQDPDESYTGLIGAVSRADCPVTSSRYRPISQYSLRPEIMAKNAKELGHPKIAKKKWNSTTNIKDMKMKL